MQLVAPSPQRASMKWFVNGFALWIFIASVVALIYPPSFLWLNLKSTIDPMLGVIMLGMGLTLTVSDFTRIVKRPVSVLLGIALQFSIMPLAGYGVAQLYQLDTPLAVGLILVACCPGGTASNVISYIARADVALSVSMTAVSTICAVAATPLLTSYLVGSRVHVDPLTLVIKTAIVVLLPVVAGVIIRRYFPSAAKRILPFSPPIAVLFIVLIVAAIVAGMQEKILESGVLIITAVATVHVLGALLGYLVSRVLIRNDKTARTTAIEVGMQNGGLGISLAQSGAFNQAALVSLPCAFSALSSCLLGSILAAVWSHWPVKGESSATEGSPSRDSKATAEALGSSDDSLN